MDIIKVLAKYSCWCDMGKIQHIQYPVGQGGLHLGIIGDYAYIYDCGGYGDNVDWNGIFQHILEELRGCQKLDIFISHLHDDHCNQLKSLCYSLTKNAYPHNITIYMPPLTDILKIILLCEYYSNKENDKKTDEDYVSFVLTQKIEGLENYDNISIKYNIDFYFPKHIKYTETYLPEDIKNTETILFAYTTKLSEEAKILVEEFKKRLKDKKLNGKNISIKEGIKYESWKNDEFITKAKEAFKETFHTQKITNNIMLCLYCGSQYTHHLIEKKNHNNWLHTGDANLKDKNRLCEFIKKFDALLYNVNYVQIPHHGSKNNHDSAFSLLFNPACRFFYTSQDKISNSKQYVKPSVKDIKLLLPYSSIKVSDNPASQIEVLENIKY